MSQKNQPLDTLCRRALRKGAPLAQAWLAAHGDAADAAAVRAMVAALDEAGAAAVHVDDLEDDPPRCGSLIVALPAVKARAEAVVRAAVAIERGLRRPDAGGERGNHFLVVRCRPAD